MDTPFPWTKQVTSHFGGTRNGMVISWPKHMKQTDQVRSQFCSVIDIAPTILQATGIKEPTMINGVKQKPIEGFSLVYSFDDPKAPTRHQTLVEEWRPATQTAPRSAGPDPRRTS